MQLRVGRRQWMAGVMAGAVIGFDPVRRSWISVAHAQTTAIQIPDLDGELTVDPAALSEAADDFGHIVHRTPVAVLRPGSIADVQRVVRFANTHRISVCMRGQGHSVLGQAQAEAGVVIDSRTLAQIESVSNRGAVVGPGVLWIDLLRSALELGLTPPVLTDYIELSVGGTLSVGGIGGTTQHHGMQVDNVLALDVVTGTGDLVRCSPNERPALFQAVLGSLGQLAIIVRARIKLIQAPSNARVYRLFYDDLATFTRDQRTALADGRFHYLEGQLLPQSEGEFRFTIEAASYYSPPSLPNDAQLLSGLTPIAADTIVEEHTYFDWQNRLAPTVAFLKSIGAWALPHPWLDLFLPCEATDDYLASILPSLTPEATGNGPILCYPFKRDKLTRPFVAMPASATVFLLAVLRFAPADPIVVQALLDENRRLFERARDAGGKRYVSSAVPFDQRDWARHYGAQSEQLIAQKNRLDPRHVLTPGPGIFKLRS